jgi:DNA-binding response OmpR family regulator
MIRTLSRMMLEHGGYAVEEARDSVEAITRLRTAERPFAAILLDVSLPDRDGPDVVPDLRAVAPRSPIVLTSGKFEFDVPNHGADGYLPKPFTQGELLAVVAAVAAMTRT